MQIRTFLFFACLIIFGTANSQINLLKDINPGSSSSLDLTSTNGLVINNTIYFSAQSAANGVELWKSDGTATGTVMVKDINAGIGNSSPKYFTEYNGLLYFYANSSSGNGIWKSDGTAAGTVFVIDFNTSALSSNSTPFVVYNGSLYYSNGFSLIKITSISVTVQSTGNASSPKIISAAGGKFFFTTRVLLNGVPSEYLNAVDINTGITNQQIATIMNGTVLSFYALANEVFYTYTSNYTYNQPYRIGRSNGTTSGTTNLVGGPFNSMSALVLLNDAFYFTGKVDQTAQINPLLWKVNATGTAMVKTFNSYAGIRGKGNGRLFISVNDSGIWTSDGTAAGTVLLKQNLVVYDNVKEHNGWVYFPANDGTSGTELWKTDGTSASTFLVQDKVPGTVSFSPNNFLSHPAGLCMFGTDVITGSEPYFLPNCAPTTQAPVFTASTTNICSGTFTPVTLSVASSAGIGNATRWQWYTGYCGDALAGTGPSITVSPNMSTTYYITGVGGCITSVTCGSVTINVTTTALPAVKTTVQQNVSNNVISAPSCKPIAIVTPNFAGTPVSGIVAATVWNESTVPVYPATGQPYLSRYYQILPEQRLIGTSGRITLYFNQTDFNKYNNHASSPALLPTGPSHTAGINNLRIMRFLGASSNTTGLMQTYSTSGAQLINPANENIIWNAAKNIWEVTFDITGFGGFFVVAQQTATTQVAVTVNGKNNELLTDAATSRNAIVTYPSPASTVVNINVVEKSTAVLQNAGGAVVKAVVLKPGLNTLDVSNIANGVYFLKNEHGAVNKIVVQHQ